MLNDPKTPYKEDGGTDIWFGQVAWGSSKSIGNTAGYEIGGWGATGGAEISTKLGRFGASLSYLWGKDDDKATDNTVNANQYSIAAHWRRGRRTSGRGARQLFLHQLQGQALLHRRRRR